MSIVAVYARKSKYNAAGESIENQVSLCKEYAFHKFGDDCQIQVYEDEGYTGGNMERPMFQKFLNDCKETPFAALVCYRLDRISRSVSDFSTVLDQLQESGVDFISINESFDTSTPMGRAMMYIASVFAQLERETIAERVRDNKYMLAHTGRWQGGTVPQGYQAQQIEYIDESGKKRKYFQLVQDQEWAPTIAMLYSKYIELGSFAQLEAYLLKNSIYTIKGKEYTRAGLQSLIRNPVYAVNSPEVYDYMLQQGVQMANDREAYDGTKGLIGYSKTQQYGKYAKRRKLSKENWIVAVGNHAGIIPGNVWVQAQQVMESNSGAYVRTGTGQNDLFSGILFCEKCGHRMIVKCNRRNKNGEQVFYYKCGLKDRSKGALCDCKNINGVEFDKGVILALKERFRKEGEIGRVVNQSQQKAKQRWEYQAKEIKGIEKEIAANDRSIQKLVLSFSQSEDEEMDKQFKSMIKELTGKNTKLKEHLMMLSRRQTAEKNEEYNMELIGSAITRFTTEFDDLPLHEKRRMLQTFIRSLSWDGENVGIHLYTDKIAPE